MEKLKEEIAETEWESLRPHYGRGGLLIVSLSLDLALVASCFATDKKYAVETWLKEKDIVKASESDVNLWDKNPLKKFNFLIVQPYVLAQECYEKYE